MMVPLLQQHDAILWRMVVTGCTVKIQIQKQAITLEAAKERLNKAILNKDERMEILTRIASGEITMKKEVATRLGIEILNVEPDFSERRAAIAEINKMDGEYMPQKKEISSTENITIDFTD